MGWGRGARMMGDRGARMARAQGPWARRLLGVVALWGLAGCEGGTTIGPSGGTTTGNHLRVCADRPACGDAAYALGATPADYKACVEQVACDGDTVWLLGGAYADAVTVSKGIELAACVGTWLDDAACDAAGAPAILQGAVTVPAGVQGVALTGLTWTTPAVVALTVGDAAAVTVRDSALTLSADTTATAVLSEGGTVDLTEVRIAGTRGFGVVSRGGSLSWTQTGGAGLSDFDGVGVYGEDSALTLSGVAIEGGRARLNAGFNQTHGLVTVGATTLTATGLTVRDTVGAGLLLAGGAADLSDVILTDLGGFGAWFQDTSAVRWTSGSVRAVREVAVGWFGVSGGTLAGLAIDGVTAVNNVSDGLQWQASDGRFELSAVSVAGVSRVGLLVDVAADGPTPTFALTEVSVAGAAGDLQAGAYVQGAAPDLLAGVDRAADVQAQEAQLQADATVFEVLSAPAVPVAPQP